MAEEAIETTPVKARRKGRWQAWVLGAALAALAIVVGALVWLDTAAGHRFLITRIERIAPASGLKIRVGAIEGSIYRKAVLRDLTLSDPRGAFLDARRVELDWWPFAWLSNRLDIDRLAIPAATLHKLPRLNPSTEQGPILPDFDIRLMEFSVGRLTVAKGIAGPERIATLRGDADIRSGRAIIDFDARVLDGDDALKFTLDSRPDDDRFRLDGVLNAPAGGVLAAMLGTKQDANLSLSGKGGWTRWDGQATATLNARSVAALKLTARSGEYGLDGSIDGAALPGDGLLQRLTAPRLLLSGKGTLVNRLLDGQLAVRSAAIDLMADGAIDLGRSAFDNLRVDARLARPQALLKTLSGRDVIASVRLDGAFATPAFEYLLKASTLTFDKTAIHDVRAAGKGRVAAAGVALIPVQLSAARLVGQGDLVEGLARNFRLDGVLQIRDGKIISNPMPFRTDRSRGELVMIADLGTGQYDLGLTGRIDNLTVPGLGIVDLQTKMRAAPAANGAFGLSGEAVARMRRLDIGFLQTLAGGLPTLHTALALRPNGELAFTNMRVSGPAIALSANGVRRADGTFHFEGGGKHSQYGPLKLTLDGRIDRPKVDLLLDRPMDAAGLRAVRLLLEPDATGYAMQASGQSMLGAFDGSGAILLPDGGQTIIRIGRLSVADVLLSGDIIPVTGGMAGHLAVTGAVTGGIDLKPQGDVQSVVLALKANDASFDGPTLIEVRRGQLDATLSLGPAGTTINATAQARGLRVGGMRLGRFALNADLRDGAGKVTASLNGQRGRMFDLQAQAQIDADTVRLALSGTIDKRPIRILRTALFTRVDDGWRLSPATISYAGGSLRLSGLMGGDERRLEARLDKMPLSLLDIGFDGLGLGGTATGSLSLSHPPGGVPSGKAELRLRGLSRSGLSLSSRPVDIGINAALTPDRLAARMLFVADGATIGRGQALMTPLASGDFLERIYNAPLMAQLRYNGTADTLWRLTGVEIVDIGGPVAISADARGTAANPVITGTVATDKATMNSPVTGMRLTDVKARGRFAGSQLILTSVSANAGAGGTITGSGRFDLGAGQGVGMDLKLQANAAPLLRRDDISATVTGPITLQSNGVGGMIGGDLVLDKSSFVMGRAAAVAEIPELNVVEVNRRGDEFERPASNKAAWTMAVKARARNRLMVSGMGLDSEWRADLTIGGTVTSPAIAGTADLVRGGYEFAGRRFELSEGRIRFDGRTPVNPTLDIEAEADVSDLSATIRVTGTGLAPVISFSSVPALPEDELLSRILFGTSITNLSAPEALQLAAAVGSLQGGGGLDPINAVRKAAGLDRLRIIAADPTQGQGTSIAAGKYLTRKTYVELITDGQGYSATRIEYQVTRWLSLLGAISTLGRQSANVRVSKDY